MFVKKQSKSKLDEAIEAAFEQLNGMVAYEEGTAYTKQLDTIERLMKFKQMEKPERLSRDTLAMVAGNLLGIIIIVGHERAHVVTSKALNFVLKSR